LKKGLPLRLVQLTESKSSTDGYTTVPIFSLSEDGLLLETEVEAYIVAGMSVPILLGEDYQQTYELALTTLMIEITWSERRK
jgi:hypothetical protein